MPLKLSFSQTARDTAEDFFAPLTGLYRLLCTDLATTRTRRARAEAANAAVAMQPPWRSTGHPPPRPSAATERPGQG